MIRKSEKLPKISINVADIKYKIDNNNLMGVLELICGKILIGKKLLTLIK